MFCLFYSFEAETLIGFVRENLSLSLSIRLFLYVRIWHFWDSLLFLALKILQLLLILYFGVKEFVSR